MDREQFCNEILKTDDKIRFVAIYDEGEFYHKMREGLNSYLTREETENSLAEAVYRWSSRKKTQAGRLSRRWPRSRSSYTYKQTTRV